MCLWILEGWHAMHCLAHILTCFRRPFHTNIEEMSFLVGLIDGWDRSCTRSNLMPPLGGYNWPGIANRLITQNCSSSKWDVMWLQTRGSSAVGLYIDTLFLGCSHSTIVNTQLYVVNSSSQQHVSNRVVLPLYMLDVCCKLPYIGQLSALAT